jgi:hypothetical protein
LNDWESTFSESIARHEGDELTTLQSEKLLQIRDGVEFVSEHRGFSVGTLIEKVHMVRNDLTEADEEWIANVRERSSTSIAKKNAYRLMRLAHELNLIEEEAA